MNIRNILARLASMTPDFASLPKRLIKSRKSLTMVAIFALVAVFMLFGGRFASQGDPVASTLPVASVSPVQQAFDPAVALAIEQEFYVPNTLVLYPMDGDGDGRSPEAMAILRQIYPATPQCQVQTHQDISLAMLEESDCI